MSLTHNVISVSGNQSSSSAQSCNFSIDLLEHIAGMLFKGQVAIKSDTRYFEGTGFMLMFVTPMDIFVVMLGFSHYHCLGLVSVDL